MKTPVWFIQDDETQKVQMVANSGGVKHIRNSGNVNITSCKMDGTTTGSWVPASAREVTDAKTAIKVNRLLEKKYSLMKKLFVLQACWQDHMDTILEITFVK